MIHVTLLDPSVVLMVGAAGSGKSTLAARLFAADEILSSDALRAAIAGDARDQRATGAAFRALARLLERRIANGRLSVIDATNVRPADRRPWIAAARRHGVPVAAIVLDLPPAVIHAQNAARSRVVDPEAIDRHLRAIRGTVDRGELEQEGVDPVVLLRSPAETQSVIITRIAAPTQPLAPPAGPTA
jgi:protein phosphatase